MSFKSIHDFHIPVMGLAYTIDSPAKVGKYGISSVVSLVEDRLIEMMRGYYYNQLKEPYVHIDDKQSDYRFKRIKDYLNLLNKVVKIRFEELKNSAFEKGSEIVKYFEMLPEHSYLKVLYNKMLETKDAIEKMHIQDKLRQMMRPGSIDVNIMTKLDKNNYDKEGNVIENGSDALTALRAYAESDLQDSSIIFSAGMNPRLYNYLAEFENLRQRPDGSFTKKIVIKVSDFRSALIQGKYLAKKGYWVSEFRIESGLNCGGHAFATDGFLIGPILEEFKTKKEELVNELFDLYTKSGYEHVPEKAPAINITFQGGIGNAEEQKFLLNYYKLSATGWGSPFLLVPESTTVDEHTLSLLEKSKEDDIILSHNSPLGVRFNYLRNNTAEAEKNDRISKNKPGSPCTEKYLENNCEFTKRPICTASIEYQKKKMAVIEASDIPEAEKESQRKAVLTKECLCIGLSTSAAIKYNSLFLKNYEAVTICPGPNIAYFNKRVSLKEMVDHIYGKTNLITDNSRPDLFTKELQLYIDYLKEQVEELSHNFHEKKQKYINDFKNNLNNGIEYYKKLASSISEFNISTKFEEGLHQAEKKLQTLFSAKLKANS